MHEPVVFDRVAFAWVAANGTKSWSFVEITDAHGETVAVECQGLRTGDGREQVFSQFVERLRGVRIHRDCEVERLLGLTREEGKANSRVVSALATAVVEFQCRYSGLSMTEALGGEPKERQLLYANLNRYLRDVKKSRTPADFGEAAEGAVREGFTILKTDPFDEVRPTHTVDEIFEVASVSLERLAAMRSAAGDDVALQVDCHGAFNVETAIAIAPELERLGVTWFEDPVRHRDELEGLRTVAEQVGIPLAAGGDDYGEESVCRVGQYWSEVHDAGRHAVRGRRGCRAGGTGRRQARRADIVPQPIRAAVEPGERTRTRGYAKSSRAGTRAVGERLEGRPDRPAGDRGGRASRLARRDWNGRDDQLEDSRKRRRSALDAVATSRRASRMPRPA